MEFKEVRGGITAAKGFLAAGVTCGIKASEKKDLAVIFSKTPAKAAAVFTTNKMAAAPVLISKKHVTSGKAQAIVANSGSANSCMGKQGMKDAILMAKICGQELGISPYEVIVASTGVIGVPLPMAQIEKGIKEAKRVLSGKGNLDAAEAIMTTDAKPKEIAVQFEVGGKVVTLGGIAKGSGMIAPDMSPPKATMLAFLTTDACIDGECLKKSLAKAVDGSFNMITVDGETSTNDMVVALANGQVKTEEITSGTKEEQIFQEALNFVTLELAKLIVKDGEGATKFIEIKVKGAKSEEDAKKVAKTIANSNLVKTAFFGEDPNWGRVLSAAGHSGADINPNSFDLYFGEEKIVSGGEGTSYDAKTVEEVLKASEIKVVVNLNLGDAEASCFTCDLTYDYVKINAEYRT